jgi:hypothetical protein
MIRNQLTSVLLFSTLLISNCKDGPADSKIITIENSLDLERSFETIEVDRASLGLNEGERLDLWTIKDLDTKSLLPTQPIDKDGDGTLDIIIFQPVMKALSSKQFELVKVDTIPEQNKVVNCYSRFVPERTDDYAWENNRVAFRTYGPTAQKMVEDGVKGGTLSSGIDAWLKKVEYPIIDKWYEKTVSGKGSYHEDTGEGLDNFHVGPSRGIGGTAVKVKDTYYFSKNFTSWKTITNGPVRTSFVLSYGTWEADGNQVYEEKHISLDYGSNLTRFEIHIRGIDTLSAGITLHENDGIIQVDEKDGWLSYWQPHEDSELGSGIVVPNNDLLGYEHYVTDQKDLSNLYAYIRTHNQRAIYFAGFSWLGSNQYKTKEEWADYLRTFVLKLNNPLKVKFLF